MFKVIDNWRNIRDFNKTLKQVRNFPPVDDSTWPEYRDKVLKLAYLILLVDGSWQFWRFIELLKVYRTSGQPGVSEMPDEYFADLIVRLKKIYAKST